MGMLLWVAGTLKQEWVWGKGGVRSFNRQLCLGF